MRDKVEISLEENGETLKFQVEKMPAYSGLLWRKRALSSLDVEKLAKEMHKEKLDEESFGMKLFMEIAKMPEDDFQVLLDGLISCCYIIRDNIPVKLTPSNIDGFFVEPETLMNLAFKAFEVNGFFPKSAKADLPTSRAQADIKRRG